MTTRKSTSSWAVRHERGSAFLIRFIAWLARTSGRPVARVLLYPITLYFVLFAPVARRSSADYLRRMLGRRARAGEVFAHLHCFAATILDRVFFLSERFDLFDIDIEGLDALHSAQAGGQGTILLGAHFGSFDAMRAIAQASEQRNLKIMMYEGNDSTVVQILEAINPSLCEQIIPLGPPESLIAVRDSLEAGDMVGILGDRITHGEKTFEVDFLGSKISVAAGPWLLSAITKAPVVIFSAVYDGGNRYKVYLQRLERGAGGNARDTGQGQAFAQAYMDTIAKWARRHPYNWFNFYDFWT